MTAVTAKTASEIQPRLSPIGEGAGGRHEEPVDRQHRGEAGREPRAQAPGGADDEHEQLVDDGHREHVDPVARELDAERHERDPGEPGGDPGPRRPQDVAPRHALTVAPRMGQNRDPTEEAPNEHRRDPAARGRAASRGERLHLDRGSDRGEDRRRPRRARSMASRTCAAGAIRRGWVRGRPTAARAAPPACGSRTAGRRSTCAWWCATAIAIPAIVDAVRARVTERVSSAPA